MRWRDCLSGCEGLLILNCSCKGSGWCASRIINDIAVSCWVNHGGVISSSAISDICS